MHFTSQCRLILKVANSQQLLQGTVQLTVTEKKKKEEAASKFPVLLEPSNTNINGPSLVMSFYIPFLKIVEKLLNIHSVSYAFITPVNKKKKPYFSFTHPSSKQNPGRPGSFIQGVCVCCFKHPKCHFPLLEMLSLYIFTYDMVTELGTRI